MDFSVLPLIMVSIFINVNALKNEPQSDDDQERVKSTNPMLDDDDDDDKE
jgi:hypothetical protein